MVAIGGWGDTTGFEIAAATEDRRKLFARNVKLMVDTTGADGELNELSGGVDTLTSFQVLTSTGNIRGQ